MEKTLQRQLLEMLQTLEEGIRYIGQAGNPAMLRECITAIRAIRETCQQSLPIRRQAVYVDLFDGMAQALQQLPDQADQATLQQTADLCQELIEYARQALQKELTRKKIMVFLPYKASMWDSLESVWKAAYEDKEHCETYVIPIPYCDRNPDMTAKEWHCEAGLFPDYVPVLDWREYSRNKLREMHPDVIFIHNPYDNFNAVTSVDMQYYSRNLKGIADKLVYIPYFVFGDTIAPHFCQTQGVINADYVIVQDENIKAQYERYYPGGNPPEGKILALGSPKFDKVSSSRKEDFDLPVEWRQIIGDKKIILYNTSLTAALEDTGNLCDKLRYVFDVFRNRKDVVLWWRPHPLMKATLSSMRHEYYEEYIQLERMYLANNIGVYDESPELDRAIVCSDAYYGDRSSVVWLYQITGKPILLQNLKIKSKQQRYIQMEYMDIDEKDDLWFIPWGMEANVLCKLNLKDNIVYCFGKLPGLFRGDGEYSPLVQINNKVIMAPYISDNDIIEYDISKKNFRSIALPKFKNIKDMLIKRTPLFVGTVRYGKCAYFISSIPYIILQYDTVNGQYIWHNFKVDGIDEENWRFSRQGQILIGNELYLVTCEDNKILIINLDNMQVHVHLIPFDFKAYSIHRVNEKFWMKNIKISLFVVFAAFQII